MTVAVAGLLAITPMPATWVERWYSDGAYGVLQPPLTSLTNAVPWAVLDPLIVGGVIIIAVLAVRSWRGGRGTPPAPRWRRTARVVGVLVVAASVVYLAFLALWGLNYRRAPVESRFAFDARRVTAERVRALAVHATLELNRLHAEAHAVPWAALAALPETQGRLFERTARELGLGWVPRPGLPKATLLGAYFRWASIAGMTNPFGLEVLLNPDVLPFERPGVTAHEWAHLAGFAHEAEANFVGWLMCLGGDAQQQYSAWLEVWGSLVAALPRADRPSVVAQLGAGPLADFQAVARRNARAVPAVSRVAWQGYDAFLRSQRVAEGVASYQGVVRLIAGSALVTAPAGGRQREPK